MKEYLVPIIGGLVLAILSSILTVEYNRGETVAWRESIEQKVNDMKVLLSAIQTNQIEIASLGQWRYYADKDLLDLETRVKNIESNRFSKEDANVETRRLEREIELLWEKVGIND